MSRDFTAMKMVGITLIAAMIALGISLYFAGYFGPEKSNISYLTYEDVSTSIDERGRLHITNLRNGTVTIYSDSVALGINAQVSSLILKDFKEKAR